MKLIAKRARRPIKISILILVALAFWVRYHYCHHPFLNPDLKDRPPEKAETESPPE